MWMHTVPPGGLKKEVARVYTWVESDACPLTNDHTYISVLPSIPKACRVGPASLVQYRLTVDVGNGDNPKALLWLQTPSTLCPPIMPWILLGENTVYWCVGM